MRRELAESGPSSAVGLNRSLTQPEQIAASAKHEDRMTDMTDTVAVAGDRIRSIIERIERIEEEIKDLMEAKKEVFAEAKERASTSRS